jgi:hypothetical protein
VMSVEVLAGPPPIRQRLSFLNERFLISALVKPNDLLMVMSSIESGIPEWQIVREQGSIENAFFLRSSTSTWWI